MGTKTPNVKTLAAARQLVAQVGTAYAFSMGEGASWSCTLLELYVLCMLASSSHEDSGYEITSIMRRNDCSMPRARVDRALNKLYERGLLECAPNGTQYTLLPKGEEQLSAIASNLVSDLRNFGAKELEQLQALADATYE